MDVLSIIHCDVCIAGAGRLSEALVIARIQTGAGRRDALESGRREVAAELDSRNLSCPRSRLVESCAGEDVSRAPC
jgi:hypothetical protein